MYKQWHFFYNPFLQEAKRNFRKFHSIAYSHCEQLRKEKDNSGVKPIYDATIPMYEEYLRQYAELEMKMLEYAHTSTGIRLQFERLRKELVPEWEYRIFLRYRSGSSEYNCLFKNGRTSFNTGKHFDRLQRVKLLQDTLTEFPQLADLKASVEVEFNTLFNTYETQSINRFNVRNAKANLQKLAEKLAIQIYSNLGYLIHISPEKPDLYRYLFEVEQIKRSTIRTLMK